ncbi:autotransporter [Novosphingobium sp.]|uniref:autotransporter n=1 Tax=Novosphingobium sp. TaxID=1874826 RepID=UPI0033407E01
MQRKISQFLASTAAIGLGPVVVGCAVALVAASPAQADTTVSTGTTGALLTSTAGAVTITNTGTLAATPGAVITVDSAKNVSINPGGTINAGSANSAVNGATGILINPGNTTTVTNSGTINVLENFTPTNVNSGFVFSPVSGVSGRYGIYGAAGGTINATIANTGSTTTNGVTAVGTINVDGENSAGIRIDGALNGSLNTQGAINVLGDHSYGVKLAGVTGNVTIGGTVTVTGSGSQGYVQSGDVTGAIVIDGAISNATSYTSTSGASLTLADTLLNTGSAVTEIDGNVTGGIRINAPTTSTSTDANRGSITAYGNNPGLQIGGATAITIGAGTTNNGSFALGIDGNVTANAYNASTPAYAVVIGGRGGAVTLTNGMENYGTISAKTINDGATALLVNTGASVPTILNTGTISATSSLQAHGNIYGVQDLSGSVKTLTNQGYITATGATGGTVAAIDLSHSTTGVTLTQSYTAANTTSETTDKAATGYNPLTATLYAGITGDIYLGTGANTVTIQGGSLTGKTWLAAGSTNTIAVSGVSRWGSTSSAINVGNSGGTAALTMTLKDYAQFNGALNLYNSTGSLTLNDKSQFLGAITNGGNFDVTVTGGTFGANAVGDSLVRNLNVGAGGTLRAYIDASTGTSSHLVANSATFASGAKILVSVNALSTTAASHSYNVLTATTLTGASTLTSSSLNLPVLFSGSITTDANNVTINVGRATATQLGLTGAQSAAYGAILSDAAANAYLQNTLLQIYDTKTLRTRFNELLPNYDGGTFDVVTRASRLAARHLDDDSTMYSISDSAAWLEPIVFRGTRKSGDGPGYKTSGGGLSMGVEKVTTLGNVGLTLAYLTGTAKVATTLANSTTAATGQSIKTSALQIGAFWRKSAGPFYIWARGSVGKETFKSTRTFNGSFSTDTASSVTATTFAYNAAGKWKGWSAALTGGMSYTAELGEHFSLRPRAFIEYDRLKENKYVETGDTPIALTVAGKTSSQTVATTTVSALWSSGKSTHEGRPFTVELEAGRRSWISGNLGTTTGTFGTGDSFNLVGSHLPSAWVGQFSIMQGGLDYTWKIGTDIERGTDKGMAFGVKASLSIAL